jgi:hypothetical protein
MDIVSMVETVLLLLVAVDLVHMVVMHPTMVLVEVAEGLGILMVV